MSSQTSPRHILFDPTSEVFATDSSGGFFFPLVNGEQTRIPTGQFDEVRMVVSLWYPSERRMIDLDRAYVEMRASLGSKEELWIKLAEIEPVVPPYNTGDSFDGWIVLPVVAPSTAFALAGGGFEPRARLQLRVSAYFVA